MTLGPVVTGARLAKDKVVRAEEGTVRARPHRVHSPRLQIHQHSPGHVLAAASLIVVDIDALQLQLRLAAVGTGWVDAVLITDDLPELGSDLVTALASLDVNNLSHDEKLD